MAAKGSKFKVRNSIGVYDIYKLIRKNHWYDIGRPVKEKEFYAIIRGVNNLLSENIANGETITFPCYMGRLELRKTKVGVSFVDGKLKNTYPVDWVSTKQLWQEDEEEKQKHTLIRFETPVIYRVRYCRDNATYENKTFYQFQLHLRIRKKLKENILNGKIDTIW
jgi:hypothetical protein